MAREMPELERYFHYRNLDVSTLKELARRWAPEAFSSFQKTSTHLALDDIRDSIRELAHYRTHFLRAAMKPHSEACERNREPILQVLKRVVHAAGHGAGDRRGHGSARRVLRAASAAPHVARRPIEKRISPASRRGSTKRCCRTCAMPLKLDVR